MNLRSGVWCGVAGMTVALSLVANAAWAQAKPASPVQWKEIVAAAEREGKVVLYTATVVPVQTRIKTDFEKAYPRIQLEWVRYPSGPLMARIDQERQSGAPGADVATSTEAAWFGARVKEGQLKVPAGPSVANWPASFLLYGAAPVLGMDPIILVYNTNLVKTPITGHRDVLRSELVGKIGSLDLLSTTVIAFYSTLEKAYGADFLNRLAAQKPRIYNSTVGASQSVAAGEFSVALYAGMGASKDLVLSAAPIKLVVPTPVVATTHVGGILGWAAHPNAAQVYMDYIMSVRGQTTWSGDGDSASALPNIPGALDNTGYQPLDLSPYTPEVVKAYTAKFNALFR